MSDTTPTRREGRPFKWESVEDFQTAADKYFAETVRDEWTITGLAIALNTSRETLMNYEKRDEFFDAIKATKDKVEYAYEIGLRKRGGAGDIFGLKNFGWRDKTEVDSIVVADVTSNGETVGTTDLDTIIAQVKKSTEA